MQGVFFTVTRTTTHIPFTNMIIVCLLCSIVAVAHGGYYHGNGGSYVHGYDGGFYGPPQPYSFGYTSQDAEGTHGHSQSSDGRRVQGHYVIQLADGRHRKVEYHADETGFHAKIVTNEQGTESKDAADALYQSSAITGEQAALRFGHHYRDYRLQNPHHVYNRFTRPLIGGKYNQFIGKYPYNNYLNKW